MLPMHTLRFLIAAAAMALVVGPLYAAEGESWEWKMSFDAGGMKMPMGSATVCQKPSNGLTPPATDRGCTYSDLKTNGNKATFKFVCKGPPPTEGSGEATRTGDTVDTVMTMSQGGQSMTMTQNGRKVGTCADPK